ncbi:Toxin HigB [hydrothermal vent metagenome]|uniref:Toxin HigB n=1 Tax=hydrothermal vent metagenome TaxID=652676 RepID=A0A3B0UIT8_9ZZZZ
MIKSYRGKKTEAFAGGVFVKDFHGFKEQAEKRLEILDAAETLGDLAALPSNRLETLSGDRQGQHSIRINRKWRICFEWQSDGPENIEITDYH